MSIFKAGDIVVCHKNQGFLPKFYLDPTTTYTVFKDHGEFIQLKETGIKLYTATRFRFANPSHDDITPICRKIQSMEKRFKERHAYL